MKGGFPIRTGIASGTLLSMAPNILSGDIVRTVILATIGATVSFIVTCLLRRLARSDKK